MDYGFEILKNSEFENFNTLEIQLLLHYVI